MSSEPLSQAISAMSRFLVANASLGDTLQRVVEITQGAVPAAAFVGISMLDDHGMPSTAIFTDETSPEIDQAQYENGRGPCLESWRQQRVVRLDDTGAPNDFPEFARAAADHGVGSVLSLPMIASGRGIGAMNLYGRTADAFTAADEELGVALATTGAAVLSNAAAYWGALELSEGMRSAMEARSVIEQAKGILMAESPGIDAERAFAALVAMSQRENVKLRDVASRIVSRRRPGDT